MCSAKSGHHLNSLCVVWPHPTGTIPLWWGWELSYTSSTLTPLVLSYQTKPRLKNLVPSFWVWSGHRRYHCGRWEKAKWGPMSTVTRGSTMTKGRNSLYIQRKQWEGKQWEGKRWEGKQWEGMRGEAMRGDERWSNERGWEGKQWEGMRGEAMRGEALWEVNKHEHCYGYKLSVQTMCRQPHV